MCEYARVINFCIIIIIIIIMYYNYSWEKVICHGVGVRVMLQPSLAT